MANKRGSSAFSQKAHTTSRCATDQWTDIHKCFPIWGLYSQEIATKLTEKKLNMDYISEIFEQLDLQQIRESLLNGGEPVKIKKGSYKERLDRAEKPFFQLLKKIS